MKKLFPAASRLALATGVFTSLFVARAFAASAEFCSGTGSTFLGFPTWYRYLRPQFSNGECVLSVNFPDDLGRIGLAVVEILLRAGGLIAVGFAVYGGFKYIISQGEPEKTKSARQTIQNAIIGILITIIATGVVAFLGNQFLL